MHGKDRFMSFYSTLGLQNSSFPIRLFLYPSFVRSGGPHRRHFQSEDFRLLITLCSSNCVLQLWNSNLSINNPTLACVRRKDSKELVFFKSPASPGPVGRPIRRDFELTVRPGSGQAHGVFLALEVLM